MKTKGLKKGCLAKIKGGLASLKDAERRVGLYLISNPEEVIRETVSSVALKSNVSEATVIRFARSIGFEGFQDLKLSLARDLVEPIKRIDENISEKDSEETIIKKVFQANISTLEETLEILDTEGVKKAARLIDEADKSGGKLYIIGVGTSASIVLDAFAKLMRIGINCTHQTDSHLQVMMAALLDKKDVVLGISHSGSTKDPVETFKISKKTGAKTISITSNKLSPLAKLSDVVLQTSSKETRFKSEALASRIAQISIVNAIFTILSMKNLKRTIENTKKIEEAVVIKQY